MERGFFFFDKRMEKSIPGKLLAHGLRVDVMSSQVISESWLFHEAFFTFRTLVRPLPGVSSLVANQVRVATEAFAAVCAYVRRRLILFGVDLLMFQKPNFQFKSLPTFCTRIQSFSCVGLPIKKDLFDFIRLSFLKRAVTSSASRWVCLTCCWVLGTRGRYPLVRNLASCVSGSSWERSMQFRIFCSLRKTLQLGSHRGTAAAWNRKIPNAPFIWRGVPPVSKEQPPPIHRGYIHTKRTSLG